ncbi:hypothetical protein DPEC_G00024680 [Dallia pectoralis]|uniref:Uncharacterized protein n=1 Tax=Dallia pectoralis TaxID=75939 RepID=A0ACC2HGZ0_DALPE|nr:hypothetical protein DPEC_G00024680 [Dallia pectoralis]
MTPLVPGAMRPRSKLLSQKRILQLPTIREGYEDLVRDMNQLNSMNQMNHHEVNQINQREVNQINHREVNQMNHREVNQMNHLEVNQMNHREVNQMNHSEVGPHSVSSDDYLLSICHLAHPTSLSTNYGVPFHNITGQRVPQLPAKNNSPALCHRKTFHENNPVESGMWSDLLSVYRGHGKHSIYGEPSFCCLGALDPLEFLYSSPAQSTCQSGIERQGLGLRRKVTHSYSSPSPSDLQLQHNSSCPEFSDTANLECDTSPSDLSQKLLQTGSPKQSFAEHLQSTLNCSLDEENQRCEEGKEKSGSQSARSTVISQWVSDCRFAWKEADLGACTLPSNTDM